MSKMMALGILLTAKDAMSSALGKSQKKIIDLAKHSEKLKKSLGKADSGLPVLVAGLKKVDKELEDIQRQKLDLKEKFKRGEISAEQYRRKLSMIERKENVLKGKKLRLDRDFKKATSEANRLIQQLRRTEQHIKKLNRLNSLSKGLAISGTALLTTGVATRGISRKPIEEFTKLEESQTQLKIAMMDNTGKISKSFAEIDRQAKLLGNRLPGTTSDFYDIATKLRQLGVSDKSITGGVLKSSAYLAVVLKGMGVSYIEAAEATAKFKEAMGIGDGNLLKFIDLIQRAAYSGVKLTEMKFAFSKVGAVMQGMGIKGYEAAKKITPLIALLIRSGFSGETVGTNLGMAMKNAMLFNAKKAQEIKKKYGVSLKFTDEKGKFIGLRNMVAELEKKLKGLSDVKRQEILSKILGTGEGLTMFNKLLATGTEGIEAFEKKMAKQADINQRVEKSLTTLSALWEAFTGTMSNVFAIVGEKVAPALKLATAKLNGFADWLTKTSEEFPLLTKIISYGVVGLSGFATVLGGMMLSASIFVRALRFMWSPLAATTTKVGTFTKAVGGASKLLASPLTLAVGIVGVALVLKGLNEIAASSKKAIDAKRRLEPKPENVKRLEERIKYFNERIRAAKGERGLGARLWESFKNGPNDKPKIANLKKKRDRDIHYLRKAQGLPPLPSSASTIPAKTGDPKQPIDLKGALSPVVTPIMSTLKGQYDSLSSTVQTIANRPEQHNYQVSVVINGTTLTEADVRAAVSKGVSDAKYQRTQKEF